jgi:hypothetical protein
MNLTRLGVVVLIGSVAGTSQSAARAQVTPQFDVATLRRNVSAETGAEMRVEPSGQVSIRNYTLFHIVRNAYGVQPFQIVTGDGVPDWFDRDRWNIVAKPPDGTKAAPPQPPARSRTVRRSSPRSRSSSD